MKPLEMKRALIVASLMASLSITGCQTVAKAIGAEKTVPDEFRVVTKAPLVIPPEFNLRPPRPGEARPLELRADLQARNAVFGVQAGTGASQGELALIARMGASNADPRIRAVIDEEAGTITHKPESFSDRLLGRTGTETAAPDPINAEAEAERQREEQRVINGATGGRPATIQQNKPRGFKLPGL